MAKSLPDRVDPLRLARAGRTLRGRIPLSRMERLLQGLAHTTGDVTIELRFELSELGHPRIHGRVNAVPEFRCQRCLEPVALPVEADVRLAVIAPGSEPRLDDGYEPLEVGDESIALVTIVEDEIILALPDIPMHPPTACTMLREEAAADEVPADRDSPFAALAGFKTTGA